jgi:site-specific DNA recombinase
MLTDRSRENNQDDGQDNLIALVMPVPATPGGGSGKLVFEDQSARIQDAVVIKAIARASVWFEKLTTGKAQSMAQIAVGEGITDNYVSNLIHLAWLSPDVVGRVLEGDSEATTAARAAMLTRKSDVMWRQR